MSYFEVLDRIKPRIPPEEARSTAVDTAPAPTLVTMNNETNKTYVTAPLSKASLEAGDFLTQITGRLVPAEEANSNGQFWGLDDLRFGLPSVAGGPLNWLHQERKIIGCLRDAELVEDQRQLAELRVGPHIKASATIWSFIWPQEAAAVEEAIDAGRAYYSMECISKEVECLDCHRTVAYLDSTSERACAHIRERSAARRFVDPIFQGAAVIIPPTRPGWKDANLELVREAATLLGESEFVHGDEVLAAQILDFVKTGASSTS